MRREAAGEQRGDRVPFGLREQRVQRACGEREPGSGKGKKPLRVGQREQEERGLPMGLERSG